MTCDFSVIGKRVKGCLDDLIFAYRLAGNDSKSQTLVDVEAFKYVNSLDISYRQVCMKYYFKKSKARSEE